MPTESDDRLVGIASYLVFNGYNIPITAYTVTPDRLMTDKTNSVHYSPRTGVFSPAQVAIAVKTVVQVEGRYRINTLPSAMLSVLYTGADAVPVTLGLSAGALAGQGQFDITNFRTGVPVEGAVEYSCTLVSNGPFYPAS